MKRMVMKKPKMRIPLPRKSGGSHKPKKGRGAYTRKQVRVLEDFTENIVENQVDMPVEYNKAVDKLFESELTSGYLKEEAK
jgi:hypothetical protein